MKVDGHYSQLFRRPILRMFRRKNRPRRQKKLNFQDVEIKSNNARAQISATNSFPIACFITIDLEASDLSLLYLLKFLRA